MLRAWQYVEVYIVSVLVTIWQLGDVSSFLVNDSCASLNDTFSLLVFLGVIKKDDAQCLYVQADILSGLFLLLLASLFLAFVSRFMVKAAKQRDFVDEDVANLKIDLTKIRLEYGEEDPIAALESQPSQAGTDRKPKEIPNPSIPIPVSEEYPCFFTYVDIQQMAAAQAPPSRMILSYDGNANSIAIAYDKKSRSTKSISGSVSVKDSTKRVNGTNGSPQRKSVSKTNESGSMRKSTPKKMTAEQKEYFNSLKSLK